MGQWLEALEAKARIIHEQMAAARRVAERAGLDSHDVVRPYFELLNALYADEFDFARLVDDADLVTRFVGPALNKAPTIAIVTSVCSDLRHHIQGIAKSIIGLSTDDRIRWPAELDPQLEGLSPGSLVVGISIRDPGKPPLGQPDLPGLSDSVIESVRGAVRSVATVARHVRENDVDTAAIQSAFPDPAIRDTVMVATSKLAPTGRKGIDSVSLYARDAEPPANPLTQRSRRVLSKALSRPIRISGEGTFEGIVRAIDLDARRFDVRGVEGTRAIRCMYEPAQHDTVKRILDARVQVSGSYETAQNRQPRFIAVSSIKTLADPQRDLFSSRHRGPGGNVNETG